MKKQITKSLICATLLAVTTFGASANDFIKGSGTVFRVIDGDTIDVNCSQQICL